MFLIDVFNGEFNRSIWQFLPHELEPIRIVKGKAKSKTIQLINSFMDEHVEEIMEIWNKAQRGEKINKIRH